MPLSLDGTLGVIQANLYVESTANVGITSPAANTMSLVTAGSHVFKVNSTNVTLGGASVSLSSALTTVRLTTLNGTDTFDAGTVNILYE